MDPDEVAAAHEQWRRERNRYIAAAHERELKELANHQAVYGEWHQGTCVKCGLDDLPVIGLPGSEHCTYCEELRVLKPKPPAVTTPAPVVTPVVNGKRLTVSLLFAIAGLLLTFADAPLALCSVLFIISFALGKTA